MSCGPLHPRSRRPNCGGPRVGREGRCREFGHTVRCCAPSVSSSIRWRGRPSPVDLAGALELRGVRVPRALALPEIKDARTDPGAPLPPRSSSAPTACRPPARSDRSRSAHRRGPGDAQKAHRRRFDFAPLVSESCHHRPSSGLRRPSVSIALRSFWLIDEPLPGVAAES